MQNICPKIQEKGLSNNFTYPIPKRHERVAKNTTLCVRHEQDKGTVEEFFQYLLEDGKSPKTIESYVGDVKGFLTYLESQGVNFENTLSRFYVTSYRNYLIENDFKPATINKKINSLQSF
ncbi:site-specific integrase [Tepidibacter mesophilus]|uniref:site-specific integrase n=1 Tax=Tepidibacter mesophilus TaxID=655607 RepID=UPI001FA891E4|nr:site-specific integrase [Tepidibacter mesophilus]